MIREIPSALATNCIRSIAWPARPRSDRSRGVGYISGAHRLRTPFRRAVVGGDFRFHRHPDSRRSRSSTRRHAGVAGSIVGAMPRSSCCGCLLPVVPFCCKPLCSSCVGSFGFVSSRNGYAWVVGSVTACLIMLMSLGQPQAAFTTAVDRVAEVTIGTMASLVVCI